MGQCLYGFGTVIRYNYFHDIGNTVGGTFTAVGVYFDDMYSGGNIFGNLFVKADNPVLVGGGNNNHVENNVIIDAPRENCKRSIDYDSRGSEERWTTTIASYVQKAKTVNYHSERWLKLFPEKRRTARFMTAIHITVYRYTYRTLRDLTNMSLTR